MIRTLAALLLLAAAPPTAPLPVDPTLGRLLKTPTGCARRDHPGEIVVCGRDRDTERQTLPFEAEHDDGDPRFFTVSRERNGLIEDRSGKGPLSCESAVGPNAGAGCLARDVERDNEQHPGRSLPGSRLVNRPDEDVPPP